jgi:hypothetical protein
VTSLIVDKEVGEIMELLRVWDVVSRKPRAFLGVLGVALLLVVTARGCRDRGDDEGDAGAGNDRIALNLQTPVSPQGGAQPGIDAHTQMLINNGILPPSTRTPEQSQYFEALMAQRVMVGHEEGQAGTAWAAVRILESRHDDPWPIYYVRISDTSERNAPAIIRRIDNPGRLPKLIREGEYFLSGEIYHLLSPSFTNPIFE